MAACTLAGVNPTKSGAQHSLKTLRDEDTWKWVFHPIFYCNFDLTRCPTKVRALLPAKVDNGNLKGSWPAICESENSPFRHFL